MIYSNSSGDQVTIESSEVPYKLCNTTSRKRIEKRIKGVRNVGIKEFGHLEELLLKRETSRLWSLEFVYQTLEDLLQAGSDVLNGESQLLIYIRHMHEQRTLRVLLQRRVVDVLAQVPGLEEDTS